MWSSDSRYQTIDCTGFGGYSVVYKCRDTLTNEIVAVKMIFIDKSNGVPSSVIREISLLKETNHSNIVRLLDVQATELGFNLVFEYLDCDLKEFIEVHPDCAKDPRLIQSFLFQTLSAVSYCHSHEILHRDLKLQNLLVDVKTNVLKLADFGLARSFDNPPRRYTKEVATLAYRAPEILLGCKYASPIDIWSVGCIFAEMVTHQKLFDGSFGNSPILFQIFSMFGVPDERIWPGVTPYISKLSGAPLPTQITRKLADVVKNLEPVGFDLLSKMLCLDPSRRITAEDALKHPYFKEAAANPFLQSLKLSSGI